MVLTLLALVVGGLIGLATGGRLRHAAERKIAWWALLVVGFGLELAADRWLTGFVGYVAMIAGPLCLLAWAAGNSRMVGIGLVSLGILANGVVLAADGGMPVERGALVRTDVVSSTATPITLSGHRHHVATSSDHLRLLDDRIALGHTRQVISIGDVVLAVGTVELVVYLLHYQPRFRRSRRAQAEESLGSRVVHKLEQRGSNVT